MVCTFVFRIITDTTPDYKVKMEVRFRHELVRFGVKLWTHQARDAHLRKH